MEPTVKEKQETPTNKRNKRTTTTNDSSPSSMDPSANLIRLLDDQEINGKRPFTCLLCSPLSQSRVTSSNVLEGHQKPQQTPRDDDSNKTTIRRQQPHVEQVWHEHIK